MGTTNTLDCELNVNTATYASPTWVTANNVKDVSIPDTRAEGDSSVRGFEMSSVTPGQKTVQITYDMKHDPADAAQAAMKTAYNNRAVLGILCTDGPHATTGTKGFRVDVYVTGFTQNEGLADGAKTVSVVLSGTTDSGHQVEEYTAA